jgi:ABC-type transport system involved in multi-copper enzyme maturation permease subunit
VNAGAIVRMTGRVLRSGLPGLIALLLGIAFFEFVQPLVIASFGGARGLDAIMDRIPPALQAFTRTRPEFLALSGLAGYLSLGFSHPLYIVLAGAAVVGFAARSLAGEMERGIIQIPLARPISRHAVYASRVLGIAIICTLLAVVGPLGMVAGLFFSQPEGEFVYAHLGALALNCLTLFWAVGALTLWGSAAASTAGRVVAWALSLLVLSYFVDYFAGVWAPLQAIAFLSLFDYYEPTEALVSGTADATNLIALAAVGVVAAVAGLVAFTRRDLPA